MENSLKTEQRAWLGIEGFEDIQLVIGKPVKVAVRMKNFGSSPALHAEITQILRVTLPEITASDLIHLAQVEVGDGGSRSVFMPGASSRVICASEDSLTTAEAVRIVHGERLLRVAGSAFYDDIFGDRHTTTFCYWYGPKQQGYNASHDGNMAN